MPRACRSCLAMRSSAGYFRGGIRPEDFKIGGTPFTHSPPAATSASQPPAATWHPTPAFPQPDRRPRARGCPCGGVAKWRASREPCVACPKPTAAAPERSRGRAAVKYATDMSVELLEG